GLSAAAARLDRADRRGARGRASAGARGGAVLRVQELPASVTAYKFLRKGSIGPFTGFQWQPGQWVESDAAAPCESGVHACRVEDLPFWCNDELWEIELGGDVVGAGRKLVASRGRLVRRVEAWTETTAQQFGDEA